MPMPYYENCPHSAEGWCLDCVSELGNEFINQKAQIKMCRELLANFSSYIITCRKSNEWMKNFMENLDKEIDNILESIRDKIEKLGEK